ncbi:MAG: hypothetical protein H0W06_09260 [Chloroflexia bacterium]|nr:hypothetical protein [Chloroflexia bacterium]
MGIVRRGWRAFFAWYERHYTLNVGIAGGLFLLQLVHLYWLTTDVVVARLTGDSWFDPSGVLEVLIVVVDYTEIPAILGTSLIYVNELRRGRHWKPLLYLVLLNSQWLHIFWITDEFVVGEFGGGESSLPAWLAWIAILIDYLELPVIYDTIKRFITSWHTERLDTFFREELR